MKKGEGNCSAHCCQGKTRLCWNKLLNAGTRRGLLALRKSIGSPAKAWDLLEFFHGNQQGVSLSFQLHHHRGTHPGTEHQQSFERTHREGRETAKHMPTYLTCTTASKVGGWDTTLANLICSLTYFRKKIPPGGSRLSFYLHVLNAPSLSLCRPAGAQGLATPS